MASALVALALLATSTACKKREAAAPETPPAQATPWPSVPPPAAGSPQTIVTLTGSNFQIDGTLVPGLTRFVVRNVSGERHSFAIEGAGTRSRLQEPLPPGESSYVDVDLQPGSYQVFCPLSGHTELPRLVVVTPRAAGT